MDGAIAFWFTGFEKGIEALEPQQRETFFRECGKHCCRQGTLDFYRQVWGCAGGDMDLFFQKLNDVPGMYAEVQAPGQNYALCFTACSCVLHTQGYISTPRLCECSRQSVLYALDTLWPQKVFAVELKASILCGDALCRLNIDVKERPAKGMRG